MRQKIFHLCSFLLALTAFCSVTAATYSQGSSAVVLAYYRIDEDIFPNSSLKFEQFKDHIDEILSGGYTVLPLHDLIEHINDQKALPQNSIAITFEGGYRSILDKAVPLLEEYELPYTVFYSSALADAVSHQHLSWEELHYLNDSALISFGVSSEQYKPLFQLTEAEQKRRINTSIAQHRKQFGSRPALFSYPDGEWAPKTKDVLKNSGFHAAFGIQSGAIHDRSDMFALPRFTMTENFGNLERFRMISTTKPLPVFDTLPHGTIPSSNNPTIGFSVEMPKSSLKNISCFTSGQDQPAINTIETSETVSRVELRLSEPLTAKRTRINCTLDHKDKLYWYGLILNKP